MKPVLFHVHGFGDYDFSSLSPGQLEFVDAGARERGVDVLPTIYLRREYLGGFQAVLRAYRDMTANGALESIVGFSMEGPLLGPEGGIPRAGTWLPTVDEWIEIASCGPLGLRYIVLAPDAMELDDDVRPGFSLTDLIDLLYDSGIRLALGHFRRNDPERSARLVGEVLDYVASRQGASRYNVITDHLYNDMPRNFVHAWRGEGSQERRDAELPSFLSDPWTPEAIPTLLGSVPAALLNAAREHRLVPCLNFDGFHVDLAICRRTVDFLGADNLIAITDHTEADVMAGERLHQDGRSRLWFRDDGRVAAGSCGYDEQARNMRGIGMSDREIQQVFDDVPRAVLAHDPSKTSVRGRV